MSLPGFRRVVCFALCFLTVGCGFGPKSATGPIAAGSGLTGHVHGGQQPVSGSKVYLYAVSTSQNGGAAQSLIGSPGYVVTGSDGNFSIDNYDCPDGANVYFLALGGNPGLSAGTDNAKLVLAAGAGPCSSLTSSAYYALNEITTVAMAFSFKGYATSGTQIGSDSSATVTAAFRNIDNLVDPTDGTALTFSPSGNASIPQLKIDSLADSLAACVNSDGTGSGCTTLLTAAVRNNTPAADTFQAAINISLAPTVEVPSIYSLSSSNAAFLPALACAPVDWTIAPQPLTFNPSVPPAPPGFTTPAAPSAPPSATAPPPGAGTGPCTAGSEPVPFFNDSQDLGSGVEFLQFPNGNFFGDYSLLTNASYVYQFDLGYEFVTDAGDGFGGTYLYDYASSHYFYTSPSLFPYLYDYTLGATLYYYPDASNPGHYNTNGIRYFYNFSTDSVISQ